jgi:hypothetical protein
MRLTRKEKPHWQQHEAGFITKDGRQMLITRETFNKLLSKRKTSELCFASAKGRYVDKNRQGLCCVRTAYFVHNMEA